MKTTRSQFKVALKECKDNENQIRNAKLVENLNNKNYKEFWKDVNKSRKVNDMQINCVDNEKKCRFYC